MDIKGKKAFITGATGLIGGRLAERLVREESVAVRALVRNPSNATQLARLPVEIVHGDITQPETLMTALDGCQLVFHSAALLSIAATRDQFLETNVEGTRNMLDAACRARVERFVHLSSVGVYGLVPGDGTDDSSPHRPGESSYCDSKIEAERIAVEYSSAKKLPLVIIRPAHVYGPNSRHWTVRFVELLKARKLFLFGKGDGICNHVYLDNLIDAVLLAAKNDEALGEAFIITDDQATTWRDFIGRYSMMLGRDSIPALPVGVARLLAYVAKLLTKPLGKNIGLSPKVVDYMTNRAVFNISKARERLGYRPRILLEEGMQLTEAWLRQEGYLNLEQ